jgi:hypothetical protein
MNKEVKQKPANKFTKSGFYVVCKTFAEYAIEEPTNKTINISFNRSGKKAKQQKTISPSP